MVWGKWTWLQNEFFGISANGTNATKDAAKVIAIVALEEELNDFQPIYRNPLLQELYKQSDNDDEGSCINDNDGGDQSDQDSIFKFITIKHGSWIPSQEYLQEAVDFSWADFETEEEIEEQELEQTVNTQEMTDDDRKKQQEMKSKVLKEREEREEKNKEEEKNKQQQSSSRRRLLQPGGKGLKFDRQNALPNPANVIKAFKKGDEGAGDLEQRTLENMKKGGKGFGGPGGKGLPPWLANKGFNGPRDFAKAMRDRLPFGNKKHLNHLDEIMKKNGGKGVRQSPKDILKNLDLVKLKHGKVTDETTKKEKEEDLIELEKEEKKRHPYMTLLTNPGIMNDIKCIKNNYRRHEIEFKVLDISEANNQAINGNDIDGKKTIFSYDNNVLTWYCYLIEIQSDLFSFGDINDGGGSFKVNLTFYDINLEIGFDYVQVYINSQLIDTVSGIGYNWQGDEYEIKPQFIYYLDDKYIEQNGNTLEVCMKIVTDSNIIKDGFKSIINIDYDDPMITKWTDWTQCKTHQPVVDSRGTKNRKHWNGDCGVGITSKKVEQCIEEEEEEEVVVSDDNAQIINNNDRAPCNLGENITEWCIYKNCYDFPMEVSDPDHPGRATLFNGHGRIDPDFPNPYIIQRSTQETFNISYIINELSTVREEIISRYPGDGEKILGAAIINHYYFDESKLRLGIRLARSLLLGDTFTVYTTGSSNTAGHENMFMSTYSMQFQSIMRPIWKRIGYKGAAFIVKNHAEGGSVSTMNLGFCIPSLIGDDADVVFWESQMNDHGSTVSHAEEIHFRNAITLPRRPMYHVMHAGKNGPNHNGQYVEQYDDELSEQDKKNGKTAAFKNENNCYGWICGDDKSKNKNYDHGLLSSPYTEYGSGLTMFFPTNGISQINTTKYEQFRTGQLYVSWHPGPAGHRVYAEILAYHYLTCAIETFIDIKDLIDELTPSNIDTIQKPIEEMLEILEDPPTKPLPKDFNVGQCDPLCTNSTESVCISGYRTLGKPRFSLQRFREKNDINDDIGKWKYNSWMYNPEAFLYKKGGLGHNDIKDMWESKTKDSNQLKFIFEAKQHGFLSIEGTNIQDKINGKNPIAEITINQISLINGQIDNEQCSKDLCGKPLKCENKERKNEKYWIIGALGCNIYGFIPYQKYEITFNVISTSYQDSNSFDVRNIRIF